MKNPFLHMALYTDFYELTMAQGYFYSQKHHDHAVFDYFFRTNPFRGNYTVFAGLSTALSMLQAFSFTDNDIDYLQQQGFKKEFLEYLGEFTFSGEIYSVREGEIVFPNTPLLRVEGNLIETQLIETLLLNTLNFQSLIATKAARIKSVAQDKLLLEFGVRRAQGWGGILASKAAIIGGFQKTSNVLTAQRYRLEVSGTMAHSWVQAFSSELEAFRKYTDLYGNQSVLLVDTYDTLNSGMPNAIKIAKEMKEKGQQLLGVRIDSGDLLAKSKQVRRMLDENKLEDVSIVVSNQLDEYAVDKLLTNNAPIDAFGIGTALSVGMPDAALDGIYKLVEVNQNPTMKVSDDIAKTTLPGKKELIRYYNGEDKFEADGICYPWELNNNSYFYLTDINTRMETHSSKKENLLHKVMEEGEMIVDLPYPYESQEYFLERFAKLPDEISSFDHQTFYKTGISSGIKELQTKLKQKEVPS